MYKVPYIVYMFCALAESTISFIPSVYKYGKGGVLSSSPKRYINRQLLLYIALY